MGKLPILLTATFLLFIGCKRETADNTIPGGWAKFSLQGNPGCSGAIPTGNYALGVALNATNTVSIQVDVSKPGSYNITAYHQGMTFSKIGSFTNTGSNTVILTGSGIPTTAGINTIPVTIGNTNCGFQVNVAASASYTIVCSSIASWGAYSAYTQLDASNKITLSVNVITPGKFNLSVGPVNGMTFVSGPLTLSSTGIQQVVLMGQGTPINTGGSTFTFPGPCSFDIVVASELIHWSFNEGGTFYKGQFYDGEFHPPVPPSLFTSYYYGGFNYNFSQDFSFGVEDIGGGLQNNETYTTVSPTSNSIYFELRDQSGNTLFVANPTIPGLSFQLIITNHNQPTRNITGTFSGTVKNGAGIIKTITNGTFTGTYP